MYYRGSEVTMLKERFKKVLINLGSKIVKYLDISIVLYVRAINVAKKQY
ncbi:hypothetical protein ACJDT4_16510 [Clostridium neuense]|uniref:Uncharacterized protein n=1 Tax=Clostridium neuense TaxID=1728934 RepID=A0ABW8THJ2_9CLOT